MTINLKKHIEELRDGINNWESNVLNPYLSKTQERKSDFKTSSGFKIKQLYSILDALEHGDLNEPQFPGEYPYVRGISPVMYREDYWTMGTYSGFGSAKDTNKRYKYLLSQGKRGLITAMDLPTQIGYDSDHPLAKGEVGRIGVAVDSLQDLEIVFEGIALNAASQVGTTMMPGPLALALFMAMGLKQNLGNHEYTIRLQNDILKEFVSRGTHIFPPGPSLKLVTDTIEYAVKHSKTWIPIVISGAHMKDAGGTAVQELAFTLINAIAYIEDGLKRGLNIDEFAPRIYMFLSANMDVFEEIAKFRCARKLWANLIRNRFKAKYPESWKLKLQSYAMGGNLTSIEPLNNICRLTLLTLIQILGGVQVAYTPSYDEGLGLPTEESARNSFCIQKIIAHETGVADIVDPLGGSYYLERLTEEFERAVEDYISKMESMGGAVSCIENGFMQREIAESAYRYQRAVEDKERIIVGINEYRIAEAEQVIKPLIVDPDVEKTQLERLYRLRKERNNLEVKQKLEDLKRAAEKSENLVEPILRAVMVYATVGEICNVLRGIYGEYDEGGKQVL